MRFSLANDSFEENDEMTLGEPGRPDFFQQLDGVIHRNGLRLNPSGRGFTWRGDAWDGTDEDWQFVNTFGDAIHGRLQEMEVAQQLSAKVADGEKSPGTKGKTPIFPDQIGPGEPGKDPRMQRQPWERVDPPESKGPERGKIPEPPPPHQINPIKGLELPLGKNSSLIIGGSGTSINRLIGPPHSGWQVGIGIRGRTK
ncbi:MAG: hypothetical protein AB1405_13210 [Bdellovibrionota bacterium]